MTTRFRNPLDSGWFCAKIMGQAMSKANSRRLVYFGGKPRFVKSKKALQYLADFELQCRRIDPLLEGDLVFAAKIYYKTKRPDLDESLILDALQGFAYQNDRQIKVKLVFWGIDKDYPRSEIVVAPVEETEDVFEYMKTKYNVTTIE